MKEYCIRCKTVVAEFEHGHIFTGTTLCENCREELKGKSAISEITQFLDSLVQPVLAVDSEGRIGTANRSARRLLGKELEDISHELGGVVFECAYAKLPDGCGQTVHCNGCAIRRAVNLTMTTGTTLRSVPAPFSGGDPYNPEPLLFRITTEKVGNTVLLQIEDIIDAMMQR